MPIEEAKKLLGLNNNEFDNTIFGLIEAAKADLKSVGIAASLIEGDDPFIVGTIAAYVRGNFDGDSVWLAIYDNRKADMKLKEQYLEASDV